MGLSLGWTYIHHACLIIRIVLEKPERMEIILAVERVELAIIDRGIISGPREMIGHHVEHQILRL